MIGGHPGESGAILPEISSCGQHQMLGKAVHADTADSSQQIFCFIPANEDSRPQMDRKPIPSA
jgi:hypothetical protein